MIITSRQVCGRFHGLHSMSRRQRRLQTSMAATTTAPTNSSSNASEDKGGIPWGLVIPLGIFGSIIGYFYRGNKNSKNEAAFRTQLRGELVMSPEELAEIREANKLSVKVFSELCNRANQAFPTKTVVLKTLLDDFCVHQLGGDFQARGSLKSRHIFDRLERTLDEEVDLDTAFLVLSLTVLAEPEDLAQCLFQILKEHSDTISFDKYREIVTKLEKTNQLPVRVLVKAETDYPFNKFSKASMDEVAWKGVRALNPNPKDKQMDAFVKERIQTPLSERDFINILLSNEICAWGSCWQRR